MKTSERLYYSDSFLKSFIATVTDAREIPGSQGESVWRLALDRSAFYPTSGGQPFDTGVLSSITPSGMTLHIQVEQVEEDERGEVWHFVREPLAPGTNVTGNIHWERRFDHMQQHTGQHLLSAVFLQELNAPTVSFHLGEIISTIDLATTALGNHSLERVERIANQIIGDDRPVRARDVSRAAAEAMLAAGQLRKLPEREGTIRLIDIDDCDLNACGGTHLRSTGQVGGLLIRGIEKVSRGVRLEFVCGMRAVRAARTDTLILSETAAMLSSGPADLPAAVSRLLAESKMSAKDRQKLREELVDFQAAALAIEAPIDDGHRLIVRTWKDRDRDYVRLLASRVTRVSKSTVVIFCVQESSHVRVFLGRSSDLSIHCGELLRDALASLGLRGGGSADMAQGEFSADQQPTLVNSLMDAIREGRAS